MNTHTGLVSVNIQPDQTLLLITGTGFNSLKALAARGFQVFWIAHDENTFRVGGIREMAPTIIRTRFGKSRHFMARWASGPVARSRVDHLNEYWNDNRASAMYTRMPPPGP